MSDAATNDRLPDDVHYDEDRVPEYVLPDPLAGPDGQRIATAGQWMAIGRPRTLELFAEHVYGRAPGAPDDVSVEVLDENPQAMDGAATLRRVAIVMRHAGREHRFVLTLFLPNDAADPVPLFLLLNNRGPGVADPTRQRRSGFWPAEEVVARGYGIAVVHVSELAPDDAGRFTEGVIQLMEGAREDRPPDAWMALAAWGWGASRAMDYFTEDERIDHQRIALVGHSRGGKAALWAAARDPRFAIAISNESGCGGAAISRRRYGETLQRINDRFPHWFAGNFKQYNGREHALPIDQHQLIALIAPRAVYVASAQEDQWSDPRGEFLGLAHASPVYALWNHPPIAPDDMPELDQPRAWPKRGYHIRRGAHDLTLQDWTAYMDFADGLWK